MLRRRHVLRRGRAPRRQEAGALPQRPAHGARAPRLQQPLRPGGASVGPGQGGRWPPAGTPGLSLRLATLRRRRGPASAAALYPGPQALRNLRFSRSAAGSPTRTAPCRAPLSCPLAVLPPGAVGVRSPQAGGGARGGPRLLQGCPKRAETSGSCPPWPGPGGRRRAYRGAPGPQRGRPAAPRPRCTRPGCLPPEQRSVRLLTWAALSAARRPRGVGEATPLGLVSTCQRWRSRLGAGAGSCQHGPGGGSTAPGGAGRTRPWGDRRRSPGASYLTFLPPVDAREMVPARTRPRSAWGCGDALVSTAPPSPTVWPAPELTAAPRLCLSSPLAFPGTAVFSCLRGRGRALWARVEEQSGGLRLLSGRAASRILAKFRRSRGEMPQSVQHSSCKRGAIPGWSAGGVPLQKHL